MFELLHQYFDHELLLPWQWLIITGEPSFGKLIDEYLHDFDIFHLAHATELLHYIDSKYLSVELGGNRPVDMNTWMVVQQNVDAFTLRFGGKKFLYPQFFYLSATKCSKRVGSFVKILNKEDISLHKNRDTIREVIWLQWRPINPQNFPLYPFHNRYTFYCRWLKGIEESTEG